MAFVSHFNFVCINICLISILLLLMSSNRLGSNFCIFFFFSGLFFAIFFLCWSHLFLNLTNECYHHEPIFFSNKSNMKINLTDRMKIFIFSWSSLGSIYHLSANNVWNTRNYNSAHILCFNLQQWNKLKQRFIQFTHALSSFKHKSTLFTLNKSNRNAHILVILRIRNETPKTNIQFVRHYTTQTLHATAERQMYQIHRFSTLLYL